MYQSTEEDVKVLSLASKHDMAGIINIFRCYHSSKALHNPLRPKQGCKLINETGHATSQFYKHDVNLTFVGKGVAVKSASGKN
jgi:hypothetical protein